MKRPLSFAFALLVSCVHPAHRDTWTLTGPSPQDCTEFRSCFEVFQRETAPCPERAALERMFPE